MLARPFSCLSATIVVVVKRSCPGQSSASVCGTGVPDWELRKWAEGLPYLH